MKLNTLVQYCLPQHLLSRLIGRLAKCRTPWLKNLLIDMAIKRYHIDMQDAIETDPHKYETFNRFFTRALKPAARPIVQETHAIACPVDGYISQIGAITNEQLIQAKGRDFDVTTLIGTSKHPFADGQFATLYLSPQDYHRIHMPLDGKLISMTHIPGRLFSVNPLTVKEVPHLFARNERLVTIFNTPYGPMAMLLVGAMLVASITTVWAGVITPSTNSKVQRWDYQGQAINLKRGMEMGRFQFGSTVILLFPQNILHWQVELQPGSRIKMGQLLGRIEAYE